VISKVTVRVNTGNAGETGNFGIYSMAGNRLVDSGALNLAIQATVTSTITPVTLAAGSYYFAQSATGTNAYVVGFTANTFIASMTGVFNDNATRVATAANFTSGGVMPATLGVLTADTGNYLNAAAAFFEV